MHSLSDGFLALPLHPISPTFYGAHPPTRISSSRGHFQGDGSPTVGRTVRTDSPFTPRLFKQRAWSSSSCTFFQLLDHVACAWHAVVRVKVLVLKTLEEILAHLKCQKVSTLADFGSCLRFGKHWSFVWSTLITMCYVTRGPRMWCEDHVHA